MQPIASLLHSLPGLPPAALAVGAALLVIAGVWLGFRIRAWMERLRLARARRQGERGEADALAWLKRNGFTHIAPQNEARHHFLVDDDLQHFTVRPDFFAERAGEPWLIEVKTGSVASPRSKETRRQIREYASLYPGRRYALFDATRSHLHEVRFPEMEALARAAGAVNDRSASFRNRLQRLLPLLKAFGIGAALGAVAALIAARQLGF
jgi:hypothetical protein